MSLLDLPPTSGATFSNDGAYRYALWRHWGDEGDPIAVFLMLNPSTAGPIIDDPTIRRCLGFARTWGLGGLHVVNLFALRSTDPIALLQHPDPVGPDNDRHVVDGVTPHAGVVVAAWGALTRPLHDRRDAVLSLLADRGVSLRCLGKTKRTGEPRHPLFVPRDTVLEDYP